MPSEYNDYIIFDNVNIVDDDGELIHRIMFVDCDPIVFEEAN